MGPRKSMNSSRQVAQLLLLVFGLFELFAQLAAAQSDSTPRSTSKKQDDTELVRMWQQGKDKDPAGWAKSILEAQEALAMFGYGTTFTARLDDQTQGALRRYQARNNLAVTGDLDFKTWRRILDDNIALTADIPLGPGYRFNDSNWNNIFTANGIWLEQGQEPQAST